MLMNQQYMLNKVPLNRNTWKTNLRTDQLVKIVWGSQETDPIFLLGAIVLYSLNHVSRDFKKDNYLE